MKFNLILSAALALGTVGAQAAGLDLSRYQLSATHQIDRLDNLGGMGLEASAVTYAADRGTLFVVGDEGKGVVEITRTGTVVGTMALNWAGTGSTNNDAEGLTYLGNGRLALVDERPQRAYSFTYAAGGTQALGTTPYATISNYSASNIGIEGISYDARNGSFVTVKQDNDPLRPSRGPQEVRAGSLSFGLGTGSTSLPILFDATLMGLDSLSDVQVLSGVNSLSGTDLDNLLILSLDSRKLVEVTRTGQLVSSLDLSGLTTQGIEGVTVDEQGVIYVVAEQAQDAGAPLNATSTLFVLSAPAPAVPEPETFGLLVAGLAALGVAARRRQRA